MRCALRLHPTKCRITSTREGFDFLGFRLRRTDGGVAVRVGDESVARFRASMALLQARYAVGAADAAEVRSRVASWLGHARQGHTRALCRQVLDELVFVRRREGDDDDEG